MMDKKLMRAAMKQKIFFIATILASVIGTLAVLGQLYFVASIVDGFFLQGATPSSLVFQFIGAGLLLGLRFVVGLLEDLFSLKLATAVQIDLRNQLIDQIGRLSPIQVKAMQTGHTLNLLYDGIDSLEKYFSGYMPQLMKSMLLPILFLIVVFPKDWMSAVIMIVTLPLIPFFMILIGKWTKRESARQWALLTQFAGFLQDVLQGLETLKSIGRSKKEGEKIAQISDRYRKTTFQVQKWAFISSLALELLATISIALIAVGLGIRLSKGHIDFFLAFYILLLAPEFYQPLRTLGRFFHAGLDAQEASKTLFDFLETEPLPMVAGKNALEHVESIRFENVSYRYEASSEDAVRDVSLTLYPGQSIAFVGDSGSGKSTLMLLALGFLKPQKGTIYINDRPYDDWNIESVRKCFSTVLQSPFIFQGTIAENIAFDTDLQTKAYTDISEIAEQIGLNNLLKTLPNGLQTRIGQGGQDLSGGQKALLLVARALYKNGDIFFLDEMTDNLDLVSEQHLVSGLGQLLKNRTVWMIAHRLQTLQAVEHVYVMKNGKIIAQGCYEDIKPYMTEWGKEACHV